MFSIWDTPKMRQYFAAFSCHLSVLMSAASFVWLEPLINFLSSPCHVPNLTVGDISWLVSIVEIGCFLAPIPSGMLADSFIAIQLSWGVGVRGKNVISTYEIMGILKRHDFPKAEVFLPIITRLGQYVRVWPIHCRTPTRVGDVNDGANCARGTLSVALSGTCYVWMAPLMVRLTSPGSPVPMTTTGSSWLTSSIELGELIGTIPAGLLADRCGRKAVMLMASPLSLIGWILIVATKSIEVLYLVRFLQGVTVAISYTVAPMYLAEVAEPSVRGKMSGQVEVMWFAGCLYAYVTGPYLSYDNYAITCAIVPILYFIAFLYVPESPYFLLMKGKDDRAMESLSWLRGDSVVIEEFNDIKASVDDDMKRKGRWKDLFLSNKIRKAILLVEMVCLVKCLGGISAVVMYASQTFEEEFGNVLGSDEMTIILGSILVVTTFSASLVTDRIGRKPLFIISAAGSGLFNMVIAVIYFLDSKTTVDVSSIKWMSYVSLICFCVVSNIGLGPLLQTIKAEYLPTHTRGVGSALTEIVVAVGAFVNIKQYQTMNDEFGVYSNYLVFSIVSIVATILFIKLVPETSGKSLEQIQESFE